MDRAAREVGRTVTTISCGGGLPVPYRDGEGYVDLDAYFKLWDASPQAAGGSLWPQDFAGD